jgi:hypothetical protein
MHLSEENNLADDFTQELIEGVIRREVRDQGLVIESMDKVQRISGTIQFWRKVSNIFLSWIKLWPERL